MQKRGSYPKYIKNSKEIIHSNRDKFEEIIFKDILDFLKNGAPYLIILNYLRTKYELTFIDKNRGIRYIRQLVNHYQPTCLLCEEKRINMRSQGISLYCEEHNRKATSRENESYLKGMIEMSENPVYRVPDMDGILDTHGDIYDKAMGLRKKIGTTDFSEHRLENFKEEQEAINAEFKRLKLERKWRQ